MIDRQSRQEAVDLVHRFRDEQISNDEFVEAWPVSSNDIALREISNVLWATYSDLKSHKLTGKYALSGEERVLLDRCVAFLESDFEYAWPPKPVSIGGLGWPLVLISIGVLYPVDFWLRKRHERLQAAFEKAGEIAAWPFLRVADCG